MPHQAAAFKALIAPTGCSNSSSIQARDEAEAEAGRLINLANCRPVSRSRQYSNTHTLSLPLSVPSLSLSFILSNYDNYAAVRAHVFF